MRTGTSSKVGPTSKPSKPSKSKSPAVDPREDGEYRELVSQLRNASAWPLFTTDAADLYATFLESLPADRRQHYECRTCRKFVEKFGGLVTIGEDGVKTTLLWETQPQGLFEDAVLALNYAVRKASVTGVFLSSDGMWGLADNASPKSPSGAWKHMHVRPTNDMLIRRNLLLNDEQLMAEKLQDFGILNRGLAEFKSATVATAYQLLTTGGLYRSEKCIGVAKWLHDLYEALDSTKHRKVRENLVWRAVALAPPGFCHIRSTMIGTLLEDIEAGKDFAEIAAAFNLKMNPAQYQRPQAAPTDGQLAAAEKIISKLGSSGALRRRFATIDDVAPHAIWTPPPNDASKGGSVFGHLRTKNASAPLDVPAQPMTWDKFNWTVLPDAQRIEVMVPSGNGPFFAFVTASDPEAPPILQWDNEDERNPVNWYLYINGSSANHWGLTAHAFVDVTAITLQPNGWHLDLAHQGDGAYFILKGARDLQGGAGIGLFPESLRSEYHGIRAAIEAYSQTAKLEGKDEASACGIALQKANRGKWGLQVRVTAKAGIRVSYSIDRWD